MANMLAKTRTLGAQFRRGLCLSTGPHIGRAAPL